MSAYHFLCKWYLWSLLMVFSKFLLQMLFLVLPGTSKNGALRRDDHLVKWHIVRVLYAPLETWRICHNLENANANDTSSVIHKQIWIFVNIQHKFHKDIIVEISISIIKSTLKPSRYIHVLLCKSVATQSSFSLNNQFWLLEWISIGWLIDCVKRGLKGYSGNAFFGAVSRKLFVT